MMMLRLFWVALYFLSAWASPIKRDDDGSRILNGDVATEGQFPFAVSFQQFFEDGSHRHMCTFSLITTKTCLGAAHCIFDEDHDLLAAENFCGIVGTTVQSDDIPCHKFASLYPHEDYDAEDVMHDIALSIFKEAITLGPNIETLRLAGPNVDILGESVTALGWGMKKPDGPASDELRYTSLNVVELSRCEETVEGELSDDQVCLFKDGTGTCGGDSGGPIVLTGTNVEIALVSFGIEVCGSLPAVYTDVRKYIDWIKEHSEGEPEIKE